jgi:hypothetical protein
MLGNPGILRFDRSAVVFFPASGTFRGDRGSQTLFGSS